MAPIMWESFSADWRLRQSNRLLLVHRHLSIQGGFCNHNLLLCESIPDNRLLSLSIWAALLRTKSSKGFSSNKGNSGDWRSNCSARVFRKLLTTIQTGCLRSFNNWKSCMLHNMITSFTLQRLSGRSSSQASFANPPS